MIVKTPVYLRGDGNSKIGLGHVHRLIALSEILQNDFDCTFIMRSPLPGVRELIRKASIPLLEIDENIPFQKEPEALLKWFSGNEIIVLDGYPFNTDYQSALKKKNSRLVCIDDVHQFHFVSDVVINPAGGIDSQAYSCELTTRLLIGPSFALLKRPFKKRTKKRPDQSENKLLICMGGADPKDITFLTLKEGLKFKFSAFIVIIGEAYPNKILLAELIKESGKNVKIFQNLSPVEMAEIMEKCPVAITSASGIAYEYLSVGGELYVKQTADNQQDLFNYLIKSQLAFPAYEFRVDNERVQLSKNKQGKVFDGASDERLLKIFHGLEISLKILVRKCEERDLLTLYAWANDPEQRSQSFSTAQISLHDHTTWFLKKFSDPKCLLYIFEYNEQPMAQVRFDIKNEAVISYSLAPEYRGRGLGQIVLAQSMKQFITEHKTPITIVGFVKMKNISSMRIFENLGFSKKNTSDYPDSYRFEYPIL